MQLTAQDTNAALDVADRAFAREFNDSLVHQAVTAYLAGGRAGTRAQKTRTQVRGGGAKPWRQKGTGRARAGSVRSPLWKGGGKIFAARPQDFSQKLNKKMYRAAISSILSELVRQDRLVVLEQLSLEQPKTRELARRLEAYDEGGSVLVVTDELDRNLELAARNLPEVAVARARHVDPVSLVRFEKVVVTSAAVRTLEEWLA